MLIQELINAKKDFLTSCYTKESLIPLFVKLGGEQKGEKNLFSILLIDLDHFKSFNDKYGHLDGDEALKYFSSSLRLSLGNLGVIVFRYGGDEFVSVFPGKSSAEVYSLSVQLEKNIKNRPLLLKGRLFKMSFSGGIASYPSDGQKIEELIDNADKAMYFSKRGGPGRITQYSKIWQVKLKSFLPVAILLLVAVLLFIDIHYKKDYYLNIFKKVKAVATKYYLGKREGPKEWRGAKPELKPKLIPKPTAQLDRIYLKSGGILKGKILYEDGNRIEIKLQLEKGEGSLIVDKSEISGIDRAGVKGAPSNSN